MQDRVTKQANTNTTVHITASEIASERNEIETMMENMFTDPRVSKQDIMDWQIKVIEARSEMIGNINEQFGKKRGGNGTKQWSGTANWKGSAKRKCMKGITGQLDINSFYMLIHIHGIITCITFVQLI